MSTVHRFFRFRRMLRRGTAALRVAVPLCALVVQSFAPAIPVLAAEANGSAASVIVSSDHVSSSGDVDTSSDNRDDAEGADIGAEGAQDDETDSADDLPKNDVDAVADDATTGVAATEDTVKHTVEAAENSDAEALKETVNSETANTKKDTLSGEQVVVAHHNGSVEVKDDVVLETSAADAKISADTVIESKTDGTVEMERLRVRAVDTKEVKEQLADELEEVNEVHAAAEFGIPGEHLVFSKPVKMTIPVEMPDGKTFEIKVQHEGEGVSTKGITQNPDATCNADGTSSDEDNTVTVRDGVVEFYTCGASLFIVDNNTNNVTVSNVAGSCSGSDYVYTVYWNADNNETSVDLVNAGDGSTIAGGETSSPITVTLAGNTDTTAFDVKVVETGNTSNESNTATVSPLSCGNASNDFIFQVKTDNVGISTNTQFIVPTDPNSTYLYHIDCDNDGMFDGAGITGDFTCDYSSAGTYTVRIQDAVGDGTGFPRIIFGRDGNAPTNVQTDSQKLVNILQWGNIKWTSFDSAFEYATNLSSISASDTPDLSSVTNMYEMFRGTAFASIPNLNNWDVSNITNMGGMFDANTNFNQDLNNWDVSNVTTFYAMFRGASSFNGDITSWNTGSATSLNRMFEGATSFNRNIGNWNVSNVTDLGYTFRQADSFNQDISGWNTSSVTSLRQTFEGADLFNQPIGSWVVSNVETMYQTFNAAKAFNQPLNSWNTSSVRSMTRMFRQATAFNQPLDSWDVSNVGLPVGGNPGTMRSMFEGATAFDQNLGNWNPANLTDATYMFRSAGLSTANYDALLTGWASKTLQNGVTFDAGSSVYCQAAAARQSIIDTYNWTINDAGMCTVVAPGGVSNSLMLWLKADGTMTRDASDTVSVWNDESLTGADFNAYETPEYRESVINFNPTVYYAKQGGAELGHDRHEIADPSLALPVRNSTAFVVGIPEGQYAEAWNDNNGNASDVVIYRADGNAKYFEVNTGGKYYDSGLAWPSEPTIMRAAFTDAAQYDAAYTLNAGASGTVSPANKNANGDPVEYKVLGNWPANNYHTDSFGHIAETVAYGDGSLTATDINKIESYLAIKYGITLDQSANGGGTEYVDSDGNTIWAQDTSDTYEHDIAGIGRDDASALDQRVSKSGNTDALVTIATDNDFTSPNTDHTARPTQLADKAFMTWANNDGDTSAWTTSGAPAGRQILGRVWKVQETGTVGTVYISVPDAASSESAKLPQAYAGKVYLLTDADGDFSSGATETELTLNGDRWELPAGIDLSDGEYFTFATGAPATERPGGVSGNLALWLKADAGITDADGAQITTWVDQSPSGYNASNSASAGQTAPTYHATTNLFNFNPTVAFDGSTDGLDLGNQYIFADGNSTDGLSMFAAVAPRAAQNGTHPRFVTDFGYYGNAGYGMSYASDQAVHYTSYNASIGNSGTVSHNNGENPAIVGMIVDFDTDQNLLINGNIVDTTPTITTLNASNINENPTHAYNKGPFSIGSQSKDSYINNRHFDGLISEVIVYAQDQKQERQKIESYLAIKYGITLDQSANGGGTEYVDSDGNTIWAQDTSDTYEHDIAGIGRDDASALDQRVSKSGNTDALVTIATDNDFTSPNTDHTARPTQLADKAFMVWANNDGDASAWTTTGAPTGRQILGRVWKVQETGTVGTVYISVPDDSSSESMTLPTEYGNTVILLVDADGDFSDGNATEYPMTLNGTRWELSSGVDLSDGEYMTFATVGSYTVEISATDDRATEGSTADGATDNATLSVTLSDSLPNNITVTYSVSGSATPGNDYTALSGTVTIPAGSTTATILIDAGDFDDPTVEGDEHVTVTLTGTDNSAVTVGSANTATALIIDDETDPTSGGTPVTIRISASDIIAEENPADNGAFTVSIDQALTENLTVTYTVGGGATPDSDYAALSGTVTIPAGDTSAQIIVDTNGFDDTLVEGDERVTVTLTADDNGGATIDSVEDFAMIVIIDDETDPTSGGTPITVTLSVPDDTAVEATTDTGTFRVTLSAPVTEDVEISYTVSGTATPDSDYAALSGTVTIPAGSTTADIVVDASQHDDTSLEGDETVIVTIDAIDNGGVTTAGATQQTVTITDDETATISIAATTDAVEPSTDGLFTLTLSDTPATDVVVSYTVSGTATPDSDYTALSGTVTIPAGSTTATIDVVVMDDTLFEAVEGVTVTIDSTTLSAITIDPSAQSATVSIGDDEGNVNPVTAILSTTTNGDENGPTDIVYTVTLSMINNTGSPITFDTAFTGGSATAGDDYTDVSGAATLSVPDGSAVGTLTVPVIDDALWDDTETVTMTISNSSTARVTISGASATATIADNDTAPTIDAVHIQSDNTDPTQAKEGDTITLTVTFSDAVQNVSATIAGVNATTVTNTGGNTWEISIPALDGSESEGLATFTVTAESLGGGALSPISSTTDGSSVTIDFTPPQEPQIIAPVPGGKITVPTPTTGQCDGESVRVEFTTTPAGGLDPEPQTLPLDAQGNFNGVLTWNSSIQGDYTLVVSCIDKAGNKTSKTVGPLTPITDPTAKKISLDGGNVFVEAAANDGTIGNDIFATIQNARFAHRGGVLQEGQDFTVTGVPNGHTLRIAISADGARAVLMLNGTAAAHENADDVRNLTIIFTDSAFDGDSQADILNSTLVLGVDYFDANSGGGSGGGASSGALQYSGFFKEDTDNTGTMRTSGLGSEMMITLGGGARFAGSVAVGNGVTVQNVPNGLTPTITRVDDTHLRLTLGGSAIQHDPADTVTTLTIVIDDAAFDGATAAAVANAIYGFGEVRFIDSDDDDGDGVSNTDEDGAHNGGDGNGDGIKDRKQQNVASTGNPVTGGTFTIEALNGPCDIVSNVQGYAESVLAVQDADGNYPVGLFGFTVECPNAGDSEEMRILLDRVYDDAATWTVRKFYPSTGIYASLAPQPTISTLTLQNGPAAGTEVTVITFTVTDGDGQTDTDTIRDRFITDPNGPAFPIISWESVTSRGGEGETVALTITSTLPLPTDVTIPLTVGGTANGDDYTPALPTTITIPAGEMDAQLSFRLTKDGRDEDDETLTITIGDGSGYSVSDQRMHTLTITDNPDDAVNLREPRDVDVTCSKKGYAKITWDDRARGEDGFKIQRRILFPDGRKGAWIKVKTIRDDNEESYKDRGPFAAGVTYQWRVRAYRDDERGEWSKKVQCSFTERGGGGGTVTPAPTPGPTTPEPTNPGPTNPGPTTPEPTNPGPTTPEPTNPEPTSSKTTQPSSASTQDDTATSASLASQSDTSSMHCGSYWLLWLIGLIVAVVLLTLFPQLVPIVIISVIAILAWLFLDACRSYWWMPLLTVLYAGVLFVRGDDEEDNRYRTEA